MAQLQLDEQHGSRMRRLEKLLQEVDSTADEAWREKTREIVQAVLEFHGAGLTRIMERLDEAGATGEAVIETLAGDDLVSGLLVLHGLHPRDFDTRVEAALDGVRPYLASHGGNVELLACTPEGAVRLRLEGSCHGCPSSQLTLKQTIEEALYAAAPDITRLDVEGLAPAEAALPPSVGFVPVGALNLIDAAEARGRIGG